MEDMDYLLALQLQENFQNEASKSSPNKENQIFQKDLDKFSSESSSKGKCRKPRKQVETFTSLNDSSWEIIDPTPDIFVLFAEFNKRFFWGRLDAVEVRWSKQMTSCAGLCYYQGRMGLCSVRLSEPLLKLRPRSDLVNTLLHEMIHAYLFVTANNRDRDGHGPEFHKHMDRINKEAGTKITVFHTFHDEVRLYQQHWWRCNGPCRERKPYYGFVKRAKNRAPGPNDFWWGNHQAECGGTYIKIQEPENYASKKDKKPKSSSTVSNPKSSKSGVKDIRTFFPSPSTSKSSNQVDSPSSVAAKIYGFNDVNKPSSTAVSSSAKTNSNIVGFKDLNSGDSNENEESMPGTSKSTISVGRSGSVPGNSKASGSYYGSGKTLGTNNSASDSSKNCISGKNCVAGSKNASGTNKTLVRGGFPGGGLKNKGSSTVIIPPKTQTKTKNNVEDPMEAKKLDNPLNIDRFQAFKSNGQVLGGHANDRSKSRLLVLFANEEREEQEQEQRMPRSPTLDSRRTIDCSSPPKSTVSPLSSLQMRTFPAASSTKSSSKASREKWLATFSTTGNTSNSHPNSKTSVKRRSVPDSVNSPEADWKYSPKRPLFSDAEVVSIDTPEKDMVACPVCSANVNRNTVNDHLDICVGFLSGPSTSTAPDIAEVERRQNFQVKAKVVVANSSNSTPPKRHFDQVVCISDDEDETATGQDDRFNVTDHNLGCEPEVPCPCCNKLVSSDKINQHLDVCLAEMALKNST